MDALRQPDADEDAVTFGVTATGAAAASAHASVAASTPVAAALPRVKFCGITCADDVRAVNGLFGGRICPAYVGFVFWPRSSRAVTPDEAATLRAELDERVSTVGVFVDAPAADVAALWERGVISVAQLHGSEDAGYVGRLRAAAPGLEVWQAFVVRDEADVRRARDCAADLALLDAGKGEGRAFDWQLVEEFRRPFALAGGLAPENVAEALARCRPAVLDVSSGIERARGNAHERPRKDPARMDAFLREVERAVL